MAQSEASSARCSNRHKVGALARSLSTEEAVFITVSRLS